MLLADISSRAVVQHADTAAPVTTETWRMGMSVKLVLSDLPPAFPCLDLPSSATEMGNSLADTAFNLHTSRIPSNRLVARAWSKHSAARCLNKKCCFLSHGPRMPSPYPCCDCLQNHGPMIRVQSALGLGSKTIPSEHTSRTQLSLTASAGGRPGPAGLRTQAQFQGLRNIEDCIVTLRPPPHTTVRVLASAPLALGGATGLYTGILRLCHAC